MRPVLCAVGAVDQHSSLWRALCPDPLPFVFEAPAPLQFEPCVEGQNIRRVVLASRRPLVGASRRPLSSQGL